jgi:hypothetical protein
MTVVALCLLIVATVMLVRAVARHRRARRAAPAADPDEQGVPTFRVVALGARGSGKTMLLASMYQKLQTSSGRSYFLTAPYRDVMVLNKWFTQIADTRGEWPSGTVASETREFTFAVRTRSLSGRVHTVLNLGYLEYAGGLLTEPQESGSTLQPDLLRRIESADAMIGIIDGYWVRQCLDGEPEGRAQLQHSLTAMISLVMLSPSPITFVVTKWDLLRDIDVDDDARLQRVRKLLMHNAGFRDLVNAHTAHRVVRLIPVSAVGPAFAELDEHGEVTKLPDGQMEPTNVDVPIAAVVPDVFEQVERAMDQARLDAAMERVRQHSAGPAAAWAELRDYLGRAAGRGLGAINPLYGAFLGDAVTELFRGSTPSSAELRAETEQRLTAAEQDIEEFRRARRKVLRDLQSRVDVLEGRLPSSRLSGEH